MASPRATIVRDDAVLRAATWEGVFFEIWKGPATPAHFRDLASYQLAFAKTQRDGKIAHVTIVRLANVTGFEGEVRKAVEERSRLIEPKLRASAVVLLTPGFVASLVRGLITGVMLLTRFRVPTKVVGSQEEALQWIAPHLPPRDGRGVTVAELCEVCAALLE
jgi:hypothetical protein